MIEFNLSEKDQDKLEQVLRSRKRPFTKHEIRTFFVDQIKREFLLLDKSKQLQQVA